MEMMTVAKNLDFYIFASSMTVQSFITMKKKDKREKERRKMGKNYQQSNFQIFFLTTSIGLLEKTAE